MEERLLEVDSKDSPRRKWGWPFGFQGVPTHSLLHWFPVPIALLAKKLALEYSWMKFSSSHYKNSRNRVTCWWVRSSTAHLFFKVKELKNRHPKNLHENRPPWKFPDPGSKLLSGLHIFPNVPLSLIVLSFCILNTHSLDHSYVDSQKWLDAMIWKRHAFKAAFIKNFIKGFATFSFACCSSFSLSCKSEESTQRHSLKIHHTSSVIKHRTVQDRWK